MTAAGSMRLCPEKSSRHRRNTMRHRSRGDKEERHLGPEAKKEKHEAQAGLVGGYERGQRSEQRDSWRTAGDKEDLCWMGWGQEMDSPIETGVDQVSSDQQERPKQHCKSPKTTSPTTSGGHSHIQGNTTWCPLSIEPHSVFHISLTSLPKIHINKECKLHLTSQVPMNSPELSNNKKKKTVLLLLWTPPFPFLYELFPCMGTISLSHRL